MGPNRSTAPARNPLLSLGDVEEPENECDLCGDDHETRDCDQSLCGLCDEVLDNCGCDVPEEIDAAEWVERRYLPKGAA